MESPGDFVERFAASIYDAEHVEVARLLRFPFALLTPWFDLTLMNMDDLSIVLETLRDGVSAAGITRMERQVMSYMQTGTSIAIVSLETRRFGADGTAKGTHRCTFVMEATNDVWEMHSMILTDAPELGELRGELESLLAVKTLKPIRINGQGPGNGRH